MLSKPMVLPNMQRRPALSLRVSLLSAVGEITGYVAIWGDKKNRDSYNTWFDKTKPPEMGIEFLPFPLLLEHGTEAGVGIEIIGRVTRIWFDDKGIAFRGYLDQSHRWFNALVERIKRREFGTSSASASHVAEWDSEGRFVKWLLTELSLTDNPAESRIPKVQLVRSAQDSHVIAQIGAAGKRDVSSSDAANNNGANAPQSFTVSYGEKPMFNNLLQPGSGGAPAPAPVQPNPQPAPAPQPAAPSTARMPLEQMLNPDVAASVTPDMLINALLESGVSAEDLMGLLQQMMQPGAPASEASSAPQQPALSADPQARAAQLLSALFARRAPAPQQPAQPANPLANEVAQLRNQMAQLMGYLQTQQGAPPANNPSPAQRSGQAGGASEVRQQRIEAMRDRRFDHLSAGEMAFGYMIMRKAEDERMTVDGVSPEYRKAMAVKLAHLIDKGESAANDLTVLRSFPLKGKGVKRSDEVMQSDLAGYGDEWVYDYQGTQLWENVRSEATLYQEMLSRGMDEKEIPQGYESETIPLEGADPTWYVTPQTADWEATSGQPAPTRSPSKFGTDRKQVTVAKLSAVIPISGELEEDSIIPVVQEANRKLQISAQEQIETILVNGDTDLTANTNINLIDGTPAAAPAQPAYTLLNGLLKLPLVTNTAMKRDCSTTFDEIDFLETFKLLPKNLRQNRDRLFFLLDSDTGIAASNIASLKTRDVFSAATLEEGVLTSIWRIDVLETAFMEKANSAGKVPNAGGTLGRLLCIRSDQWASRWKRRMRIEVERYAVADARVFVAHLRWGIAYRKTNVTALTYNIPLTLA